LAPRATVPCRPSCPRAFLGAHTAQLDKQAAMVTAPQLEFKAYGAGLAAGVGWPAV
jgi:hypothetical protein